MNTSLSRWLAAAALSAAVALTTACGGGGSGGGGGTNPPPSGGGGGGTPPPTQGIDGVGIAIGPITGFGSVIVNGVRFDTSRAEIRVDDNPGVESDLEVGQLVQVTGTFNADNATGVADRISFDDVVEGPVSAVDEAAGTLTVLGQQVRVTGTTVFDDRFSPASLAGVTVGGLVEVSGFIDAAGVIVATRIEPKAAGEPFELRGAVSGLTATRFNLSTTVVDYSSAQVVDGVLANGACVEAKGQAFSGGVLQASRVEVEACGPDVASGNRGQVEGVITRFGSSSDFDVGSIRVATSASTVYERGVAGDLRLNLKVEVEGTFDANRVLLARKVEIKPDTSARLLGTVEAIDGQASSVAVFGITVFVDAGTSFEDKSDADLRPFRFSDLGVGDYLEVRGFEEAQPRQMRAVRLEREDLDSRRELQGTATDVSQPSLRIIGVAVTTTGATQFRDVSGAVMSAQQFFAAAGNRLVKVRGSWDGTTFVATEAELES